MPVLVPPPVRLQSYHQVIAGKECRARRRVGGDAALATAHRRAAGTASRGRTSRAPAAPAAGATGRGSPTRTTATRAAGRSAGARAARCAGGSAVLRRRMIVAASEGGDPNRGHDGQRFAFLHVSTASALEGNTHRARPHRASRKRAACSGREVGSARRRAEPLDVARRGPDLRVGAGPVVPEGLLEPATGDLATAERVHPRAGRIHDGWASAVGCGGRGAALLKLRARADRSLLACLEGTEPRYVL